MARKILNGLDLSNTKIINIADPSSSGDAVNLSYLQNFVRGLTWGDAVLAASTANVNISSPGASIDGVSLTNGDRVLLKDQSTASENGVYVFNGAASALTRSSDWADSAVIRSGRATTIISGSVNDNKVYVLSNDTNTVTIGTTGLTFALLGGGQVSYVAGDGLSLTDGTFAVKLRTNSGLVNDSTGIAVNPTLAGNGLGYTDGVMSVNVGQHLTVSSDTVSVDTTDLTTNPSTVVRKYAAAVPSGNTSAVVTHNLGTRDVNVLVYENSGSYDQVYPDVQLTSTTTLTLVFSVAPTSGQYRVVVHG